jgi:signal transduction histidine kinase
MLCKSVGREDDGHAVISVSDTGIGIIFPIFHHIF